MFDIQRFNDKIVTTKALKVNLIFEDGDYRLISIDAPNNEIDAQTVKSTFESANMKKVFIGDKTGAEMTGTDEAYIEVTTKTTYDLIAD